MEVRYFKGYSYNLNREMEFKVYGHRGKPVLFIPCQAGRFYDFENFHMDDVFRPYIDAGEIMVFSIDTIDNETWADHGGNPRARIEQHERWFNYIVDEMVPQIRHLAGERNWCQMPIMPFGCSMGAMHAANLFFRRPDLFDSVLALSGVYDSFDSFGDYMDDLVYRNSPYHYLSGMSEVTRISACTTSAKSSSASARARGKTCSRKAPRASRACSTPRASTRGWTSGATTSITIGAGGTSRSNITCLSCWENDKLLPSQLRRDQRRSMTELA